MKINPLSLKALRVEIDDALRAVGEKHGCVIKAGNCRFTENTATFKLELTNISADGVVADPHRENFDQKAVLMGIKPDSLDKEFQFRGERYQLTGINMKKRTFPFCCKRLSDGKTYGFPESVIAREFGIKPEVVAPSSLLQH